MVNVCIVFGCKEHSGGNYKLHRFPKDQELRVKWIDAYGRADKPVGMDARVCAKHFSEGQLERNLMFELTQRVTKTNRGLKNDAVPDLHLPSSEIISSCQAATGKLSFSSSTEFSLV